MAKKSARVAKKLARRAVPDKAEGRRGATMVRVTFAGGRVEMHPDDGRSYPDGTMLQWSDRWTVVGCAWPFDD